MYHRASNMGIAEAKVNEVTEFPECRACDDGVLLPLSDFGAQALVDDGAALVLEDRRDAEANRGPLEAALNRLVGDDAYRERMRDAARAMALPDAAAKVAEWMSAAG